jgi:phosphohistidine phosphatase SixA
LTVWAALLVAALLALTGGCGQEEGSVDSRSAMLVERLREGGYVLALRHAATDSGMDTTDDLSDCSRQRNLDAEGRRQSRSIGRALRHLGIPVGRVMASPFCRTRDTARLAFGRVRASRALLSPEFFASPREARQEGLPRLLRTRPQPGTNTVLVSHGAAIYPATGRDPEEGEAVIVAPRRGRRGFDVVATLEAGEWAGLVN